VTVVSSTLFMHTFIVHVINSDKNVQI